MTTFFLRSRSFILLATLQVAWVGISWAQTADLAVNSPSASVAPSNEARKPTALADMPKGLGFDDADTADAERLVFRRAPVRLVLPVGKERLVTFPSVVALHAPEGFEGVIRFQIIERTAYIKALVPFGTLRVVAEDISTGRQIPLDLVSADSAKGAAGPVEVFLPGAPSVSQTNPPLTSSNASQGQDAGNNSRTTTKPEDAGLDMVGLTRYAAQLLYGPKRLLPALASVRQIPMSTKPVEGLYRGAAVSTTPLGAWRSGQLYVTAVLLKNLSQQPMDIDLQELRGQWLAATAQHTRLLAADSDWGTTTIYLVCDRPFAACR